MGIKKENQQNWAIKVEGVGGFGDRLLTVLHYVTMITHRDAVITPVCLQELAEHHVTDTYAINELTKKEALFIQNNIACLNMRDVRPGTVVGYSAIHPIVAMAFPMNEME